MRIGYENKEIVFTFHRCRGRKKVFFQKLLD